MQRWLNSGAFSAVPLCCWQARRKSQEVDGCTAFDPFDASGEPYSAPIYEAMRQRIEPHCECGSRRPSAVLVSLSGSTCIEGPLKSLPESDWSSPIDLLFTVGR